MSRLQEIFDFTVRQISEDQDLARLNLSRAHLLMPEVRTSAVPLLEWIIDDGHAKRATLGRAMAYTSGEEVLAVTVIRKLAMAYRKRPGYLPEWGD